MDAAVRLSVSILLLAGSLALGQTQTALKAASAALDARQYGEALSQLKQVRQPKIADYAAWMAASAYYELNDNAGVVEALKPVWTQVPKSPLIGRGAMLSAKTYIRANEAGKASEVLKRYYDELSQPDGDLALAAAYEAAQDSRNAVLSYQRVYYNYPTSPASDTAEAALSRLQGVLGSAYPTATAQTALSRAVKLTEAGSSKQARRELEALAEMLTGADRDYARVRVGMALYNARENKTALDYLKGLQISTPDADAERVFYMMQCARRLNNLDEVTTLLGQLAQQYPKSKWRVEALVAAANQYIVTNQANSYDPLFRTCANEFPESAQAANCHWHVAFLEYMRRSLQSADLMQEHVKRYPNSDHAPTALYFLGRLAEQSRDFRAARAYYDEINTFYPNYYYAVLARVRLADSAMARVPASNTVNTFLRAIAFPPRSRRLDFTPNATTQARIDRAKLLSSAGLDDYADGELRYGARTEDQPQVLGITLAEMSMQRKAPEKAIRYLKRYAPAYLYLPLDSAPTQFWKLAFPLPYREPLEKFSKAEDLDPFLVAALIRQESEFDKNVVSHAKAYGLTQVLPSTGRELSRRLGFKGYNAQMLFQPEFNLQLGTYYLKLMLGQLNNNMEATLAAYNAGKSRSVAWLSWYEYREPAEFVEMIPFTETRNYVQVVLRNADVYRRLYGGGGR